MHASSTCKTHLHQYDLLLTNVPAILSVRRISQRKNKREGAVGFTKDFQNYVLTVLTLNRIQHGRALHPRQIDPVA